MTRDLEDLILSEKANQLAHDAIGIRCRRITTGLVVLSAVLGYSAGASPVAKTLLAFFAGLAATAAVGALTVFKSGDHLRFAGEYEQVLMNTTTLARDDQGKGFEECRKHFFQIVARTRDAGVSLSDGQVVKYEKRAKEWVRRDTGAELSQAQLLGQNWTDVSIALRSGGANVLIGDAYSSDAVTHPEAGK
jgi:hypothetical protein